MSLQSAHQIVHQMPFFFVARFPNFVAELRTRYGSNLQKNSHRIDGEREKVVHSCFSFFCVTNVKGR